MTDTRTGTTAEATTVQQHAQMLSLDVIRGIALCGIAFVNFQQQWSLYPGETGGTEAFRALELLAHQHFFPVFTFLFGIGFAMIANSARRRGFVESSVTGIVYAATWVMLTYVLLRTPVRSVLGAMFASLGRMALTNYILATFVIIAARRIAGIAHEGYAITNDSFIMALLIATVMLIVQAVLSWLWLRRFRQGPLEKAWRYLTWEAFDGPKKAADTAASTAAAS